MCVCVLPCCEHFMVFLFEICQKAVKDFGIIISVLYTLAPSPPLTHSPHHPNISVLVTRGVYDSCEVFEITITKYINKRAKHAWAWGLWRRRRRPTTACACIYTPLNRSLCAAETSVSIWCDAHTVFYLPFNFFFFSFFEKPCASARIILLWISSHKIVMNAKNIYIYMLLKL